MSPARKDEPMPQRDDYRITRADAIPFLLGLKPDSCDLIFGSPPYSGKGQRYGEGTMLVGKEWAAWMTKIYQLATRACTGLVAFVINSGSKNGRWDAAPAHLMAMLDDAGLHQYHPACYYRYGIASAVRGWWKNCWEFVICVHRPGTLPWSDPLAIGAPPKFPPGGAMSHRLEDGRRKDKKPYSNPAIANPGDVIIPPDSDVRKVAVGGGHMGHPTASDTEAPMPLKLAEAFVRCFCPYRVCSKCGSVVQSQHEEKTMQIVPKDVCGQQLPANALLGSVPQGVRQTGKRREAVRDVQEGIPSTGSDVGSQQVLQPQMPISEHDEKERGLPGVRPCHQSFTSCKSCGADLTVPGALRPGLVIDPFLGSGTTLHAAMLHGRRGLGCDLRDSQIALTDARLDDVWMTRSASFS
jgi:hypothetical protein